MYVSSSGIRLITSRGKDAERKNGSRVCFEYLPNGSQHLEMGEEVGEGGTKKNRDLCV